MANQVATYRKVAKTSMKVKKNKEVVQVNQLLSDLKSIMSSSISYQSEREVSTQVGVIESAISYIHDLREMLSNKDLMILDQMFTSPMKWCIKST